MMRRLLTSVASIALLISTTPAPLQAQPMVPPPGPPAAAPAEAYSAEQLDAILAPIALYPDQLLTQVLMASAYPEQVTEAANWAQAQGNQALRGDALAQALAPLPWDPSVKSLVPFPQVLGMMNANPGWVQQLGFAVAVQQDQVLDSIQRLRRQAELAGKLRSTPQQIVRTEQQYIYIEPAQPDVVYVPVYDPRVVYGTWLYPAYPPIYLPPPPGLYIGAALVGGLFFGAGIAIVGGYWGWATPRWHDHYVYVDRGRWEGFYHGRPPPVWGGDRWRPPPPPRYGGGFRPPPFGGGGHLPGGYPGGHPPSGGGGHPPGGYPGGHPPSGGGGHPPSGGGGHPPGGYPGGHPPSGGGGHPLSGGGGHPPGGYPGGHPPSGGGGHPLSGGGGHPPGGYPGGHPPSGGGGHPPSGGGGHPPSGGGGHPPSGGGGHPPSGGGGHPPSGGGGHPPSGGGGHPPSGGGGHPPAGGGGHAPSPSQHKDHDQH